jgi:hypothetical protein
MGSQAPEVLERGQVIFANAMGIEQVKSQQADIRFLFIGYTHTESYWLLYPDKHMMLWRYTGPFRIVEMDTYRLSRKGHCSEYEDNQGLCSEWEIKAEGMLARAPATRSACMSKNTRLEVVGSRPS